MMLSSRSSLAARALLRPSTVLRRSLHPEGTHMNKPAYRLVLIRCACEPNTTGSDTVVP